MKNVSTVKSNSPICIHFRMSLLRWNHITKPRVQQSWRIFDFCILSEDGLLLVVSVQHLVANGRHRTWVIPNRRTLMKLMLVIWNPPSALLPPCVSNPVWFIWWFQVRVYWVFIASDLLSHTLITDIHFMFSVIHLDMYQVNIHSSQCFCATLSEWFTA